MQDVFSKYQMIQFLEWYDSKNEDDCHRLFSEEFDEWVAIEETKPTVHTSKMTSHERHQISMFEEIETALSQRPFDNSELDFILKAIKNSKSFVVVFGRE